MRIALLQDGATEPVWLAGDPNVNEREFSRARKLRIESSISAEGQTYVRAAVGKMRDRSNLLTTLTWDTMRLFACTHEADLWALDYDLTQPREGTLVLETPVAGGVALRRYMQDAVVKPPERRVNRLTVHLVYTATGGLITDTAP